MMQRGSIGQRVAAGAFCLSFPLFFAGYHIKEKWTSLKPTSAAMEDITASLKAARKEERTLAPMGETTDQIIDRVFAERGIPTKKDELDNRIRELTDAQGELLSSEHRQGIRIGLALQTLGILMLTGPSMYLWTTRRPTGG